MNAFWRDPLLTGTVLKALFFICLPLNSARRNY
jgi:hypothetical protein